MKKHKYISLCNYYWKWFEGNKYFLTFIWLHFFSIELENQLNSEYQELSSTQTDIDVNHNRLIGWQSHSESLHSIDITWLSRQKYPDNIFKFPIEDKIIVYRK